MKRAIPALILAVSMLAGCKPATAPAGPPAPGYTNQTDQAVGQSLAALRASVYQATQDYPKLSVSQQLAEKVALNNFVMAVNLADSTYTAFHSGQATLTQAQNALDHASASQIVFVGVAK